MFIPLTINQHRDGLKNVLIAGDTAGIFYLLNHIKGLEVNVFLADTGIRRPLREFPCHRDTGKDRANVYYDFFDGGIGGGIVRRMDYVLTSSLDLSRLTKSFLVPAIHLYQDGAGTWLRTEGYVPRPEISKIGDILQGFVQANLTFYREDPEGYACKIHIDLDGAVHMHPARDTWNKKPRKVTETTYSAWDRAGDILKPGEAIKYQDQLIGPEEERRLIELGIPELHTLSVKKGEGKYELRELTGDLARVLDGLVV